MGIRIRPLTMSNDRDSRIDIFTVPFIPLHEKILFWIQLILFLIRLLILIRIIDISERDPEKNGGRDKVKNNVSKTG